MATSEELRRELDRIRREIGELQEYEHEVETTLGALHGRFKWLRAPGPYLLKWDVARQIHLLKWRNNVVRNCYLAVKKDKEGEQGENTNPRSWPDGRMLGGKLGAGNLSINGFGGC